MTNSEQAIREKAINIFADIFAAGGEAHEVGGQSFDQLQQSGYIDRKLADLTALISEHYYTREFLLWFHNNVQIESQEETFLVYNDIRFYTLNEVRDFWQLLEQKKKEYIKRKENERC